MRLSEAVVASPRIVLRVGAARGAPSNVPGPPGDVGKIATRAAMAALAGAPAGTTRYLMEAGRQGIFIFDAADLSAAVAADANQGLYVPPAADPDGSSGAWVRQHDGPINAEWFGLSTAATAAANTAIIDAMVDLLGDGPVPVQIEIPAKVYPMNEIGIEAANLHFVAYGATLTGATASFVTSPDAADTGMRGGKIIRTDGGNSPPVAHLNGPRGFVHDVWLEKAPEAGGYMIMAEYGGAGTGKTRMHGLTLRGGNGIFLEGPGHHLSDIDAVGRAAGADDFIAFKARNCATVDCVVEGVSVDGYSNLVAIGSEVGTLGAASPGRAGRVQNNRVTGVARRCTFALYIKPGAIDAGAGYDWRDGLVADNFVHLQIADPAGEKMQQPGVFSASRGALVCNNKVVLQVTGRVSVNVGVPRVGIHFYIPDYSGVVPAAAAPTIRDNRCELHYDDPYDGVANGVGGAPGHPVQSFVNLEKETPAHGTFARNRVTVFGNGCLQSGIYVGAGCDDGLIVERAELRAVNSDGSNTFGGIRTFSRITVGPDITISGGGRPYVVEAAGDVICPELEEETYLFAQVNAGNADIQYPWVAKHRAQLIEVSLNSTVAIAASDADYTTLQFRNIGLTGNVFHQAQTKATGGTGESPNFVIAAGAYSTIFRLRDKADAGNLSQTLFARGAQLHFSKADTGAGRTVQNARLLVRAAPY